MARSKQTRRLGRGLSSLMAEPVAVEPPQSTEPTKQQPSTDPTDSPPPRLDRLELASIIPNSFQPRKRFSDDSLDELARSIRSAGVLQPIVVRPISPGAGAPEGVRWELVAGERRWRAAGRAGLERIPAVITEATDRESAELALVENLQREDLNPVERAQALRRLRDDFGLTQSQVAEQIGLDRATVANLIRLTELEPEILDLLSEKRLTAGHGKALLALEPGAGRIRLAKQAVEEGWSVRRLEAANVSNPGIVQRKSPRESERASSAHLLSLERKLGDHLGAKLKIRPNHDGASGVISITYFDLDHFESLLEKLNFHRST